MGEAFRNLTRLNAACNATLEATFTSSHRDRLAEAYVFVAELDVWRQQLASRPEVALFDTAHGEYLVAMLNVAQGQYRNAFKSLRLVLELYLQGVLLSTDLIALKEWLSSCRDTSWARIIGQEGVFGERMAKAFFPDLEGRVGQFREDGVRAYRTLSTCIHGNATVEIPLPEAIIFHEPSLDLWLQKANAVRRITHFALTVRYLQDLDDKVRNQLESVLTDVLGDIPDIRKIFGGRVE